MAPILLTFKFHTHKGERVGGPGGRHFGRALLGEGARVEWRVMSRRCFHGALGSAKVGGQPAQPADQRANNVLEQH